jgi:hypothetical protein
MARRQGSASKPAARQVLVWAALSLLMAGVAGATGYLVGRPTEDVAADPPPRLLRATQIYASGHVDGGRSVRAWAFARGRRKGHREGLRHGRRAAREEVERGSRRIERGYRRGGGAYGRIFAAGRAAGARAVVSRFRFGPDGFYLVGVAHGGRRVEARHGPLREGAAYELCHGERAICVTAR